MLFPTDTSRRTFLKYSLCATAAALLYPRLTWGAINDTLTDNRPLPQTAPLSLYNTHTNERLTVAYRNPAGNYDPTALSELNHLLRCHYTNEIHPIDPRTLDYLSVLDQKLGGGHDIHIISAYRSPRYNNLLRSKGGGVASRSLHLEGRALDIRIPGVSLARLKEMALHLGRGGVGYYPRSDFVHIDSGPFRRW